MTSDGYNPVPTPSAEERRLANLACDWREKFQKQLARAVAAEERAGRKNVARLEARIAELEAELAAVRK